MVNAPQAPAAPSDPARDWARLDTRFAAVAEVFPDLMAQARATLAPDRIDAFLDAARALGKLGRGVEPMLAFLEAWPEVVAALGGEDAQSELMALVAKLQKSPNGQAIAPLMQSLAAVARRLKARALLTEYLLLCGDLAERTASSIHGGPATFPSPGLPAFLAQAPHLLGLLSLGGLRKWVEYGVRNHRDNPDRQREYFALASADSKAVLHRERHGTLFADVERQLTLGLRALWREDPQLVPYSTAYDTLRKPIPYDDALGMRVPDVFDDAHGVRGIDRYRAVLAHMAGHRQWTTPQIADNWSPFQRMAVEFFEDARIDLLACRVYPGLRRILLALHPHPREGDCDEAGTSCLRFRLAMMSRALLDPDHGYVDPLLRETVASFHALVADGPSDTPAVARLALAWVTASRRPGDQAARVHFDDTVVDYRDDNRGMWRFIEDGDEEESFDRRPTQDAPEALDGLPPRHYPEWDADSASYRPDWVTVYEALHPSGDPARIDALLARHAPLARRLARLFDQLKPQERVRLRYQEEGSELDLDVALRAYVDRCAGSRPDPRINVRHRPDGRDIAVLLLLDLSESLNDPAGTTGQSILELSREAVSLLGWAIERLGDPFAIGAFRSHTRHEVRYQHIKGFSEHWGDAVKARVAAMEAGWSTRMGAAMRHAANLLSGQRAQKRLLLILTDGRPSDVDVQDPKYLIDDSRRAVMELRRDGIFSYCISLDPGADAYVRDVFGGRYTVIDQVERLPEKLPALFAALTR